VQSIVDGDWKSYIGGRQIIRSKQCGIWDNGGEHCLCYRNMVRYGEGDMKIWFEVLKEQSNFTFSVREKGKIRDETIINRYRARCINILGKTICICWGIKNESAIRKIGVRK
jgi:hypothetical protein